jgi:hypothetical protein
MTIHRSPLLARGLLALGALLMPALSPASAGTALRLDTAGLVANADLIVEGRVLHRRAVVDARGRIATEYVLDVARTFWGADEPLRVVRLPGGVLPDGRGLALPGMPRLAAGEDVLLFLAGAGELRMPVGLAQGKYRVYVDRGGMKRVRREHAGLALASGNASEVDDAEPYALATYAELTAEIEAALSAKRARAAEER